MDRVDQADIILDANQVRACRTGATPPLPRKIKNTHDQATAEQPQRITCCLSTLDPLNPLDSNESIMQEKDFNPGSPTSNGHIVNANTGALNSAGSTQAQHMTFEAQHPEKKRPRSRRGCFTCK